KESTERGVERTPAGVGLRVRPRLGVAAEAAAGLRHVQAALRVALRLRVRRCGGKSERAVQNKKGVLPPPGFHGTSLTAFRGSSRGSCRRPCRQPRSAPSPRL